MNGTGSQEIVEVKCKNCNKSLYIVRSYVREKMFCIIQCLEEYDKKISSDSV